jgi:hypothetical protein
MGREESEIGALKNSLRVTEPLNLLPIPPDERLTGTAARNLVGPAVHAPFFRVDMSGQIIRVSIPIATIAICGAMAFPICWVGLALLGF